MEHQYRNMALGVGNNNKKNRRRGVERRAFYKSQPHLTTEIERPIHRSELAALEGQVVKFSGELSIPIKNDRKITPILLHHVVVNGNVYIDHLWVTFRRICITKLIRTRKDTRVYCTGEVGIYESRHGNIKDKYGIKNPQLVKEI